MSFRQQPPSAVAASNNNNNSTEIMNTTTNRNSIFSYQPNNIQQQHDYNESTTGSIAASATTRRQRAMSRVNVAATYAKEPARLRALTIAQQKEDGGEGKVDDATILSQANIKWYQTIHKLHAVCAVFSIVAFILGMVSFLTDYWKEVRIDNSRKHYGLFWQCGYEAECSIIDWRDIHWTVNCVIGSDRIKWVYYVNRGFIFASISACVITFVLIMLSVKFYLSYMKCQSYLVMLFMIFPVICWSVAIGRFAAWENGELYCGTSYCEVQKITTGSSDCDESFGWSFILGVLCLILHVFGAIFAIARHIFGEWALEEVQGDDLAQTTRRVNVEHTVRRVRAQTLAVQKAQEEEERKRKEKEKEDEASGLAASQRRARGRSTIIPLVHQTNATGRNSRSISQFTVNSSNEPHHNSNQNQNNNNNAALQQFQQQIAQHQQEFNTDANYQQQPPQQQEDWTYDENSGLEWSETRYLFRDPASQHLYDPNSGQWFDPVSQEWYQGESASS